MTDKQSATPFPWAAATACLLLVLSAGLVVGGVYLLAGLGWALLAGSSPCLVMGLIILRGLTRGQVAG